MGFHFFLNTNYKQQRSCFELFSFLKSIKKHASKCFFQTLSKQRHLKKVKNRIVVFIFENTPEKWTIRINIYKISEIQKILASWVWTKTRFARVSSIIFCRGYESMLFCRGYGAPKRWNQHQRFSINSLCLGKKSRKEVFFGLRYFDAFGFILSAFTSGIGFGSSKPRVLESFIMNHFWNYFECFHGRDRASGAANRGC